MDAHSCSVFAFGDSPIQSADGSSRGGQPIQHRRTRFRPGDRRYLSSGSGPGGTAAGGIGQYFGNIPRADNRSIVPLALVILHYQYLASTV